MLEPNIMMLSDSYKFGHYQQYPPKTEYIYSYFESRVGAKFDRTVFFGLQYYLIEYLAGQVITQNKIDIAEERVNKHLRGKLFNRAGWEYILKEHEGRLPVIIKAVEEGKAVPTGNVLMTIQNTDPKCYWLTNFLETLLVQVWYPSTVATQSAYMKRIINGYADMTADADDGNIDFSLHDFGFRGVSCPEQAGLGGMAHLTSFKGTDTFAGIEFANEYYDCDMAGFSIPASEHSTITSWGHEHENDAMRNMLEQYPTGPIACVSDSYDIYKACSDIWGTELHDIIVDRNGTLVIRPDSGDAIKQLPVLLDILGDKFGYHINSKGYKVLPKCIRLIQGDNVYFETLPDMLEAIMKSGWSTLNVSFGSGGGLLQKLNRDTQRFAFKCSYAQVDGLCRVVTKNPVTGNDKASKGGVLELVENFSNEMRTYPLYLRTLQPYTASIDGDLLTTRFCNGYVINKINFNRVRENVIKLDQEAFCVLN